MENSNITLDFSKGFFIWSEQNHANCDFTICFKKFVNTHALNSKGKNKPKNPSPHKHSIFLEKVFTLQPHSNFDDVGADCYRF